ncbi:hypothetical protein [Tabrizicola soli]|uniref:SPOR domain-containing protein n=1 Tax=Tabrizicola soli TaxID=2185115 RepID=A0ABV7DXF6_9RHOB|nr:hypothetical protein [Tabrizicola soli]
MADENYKTYVRETRTTEGSGASMALIVGGLVVAVGFILWLVFGGPDSVVDTAPAGSDTNVTIEPPAAPVDNSTNVTVEPAAPEAAAPEAPAPDATAPAGDAAPADGGTAEPAAP